MSDELSYSMLIEHDDEDIDNLRVILPKKKHAWVDDKTVTECYNCRQEFYMFRRRHHCRLCGRIFCHNCSKYWEHIPEELLSTVSQEGTWTDYLNISLLSSAEADKMRVCVKCHLFVNKLKNIEKIVNVFNIIGFDVIELNKLKRVCSIWLEASLYCLGLFKEIQYKLPTEKFTRNEINLLWRNSVHFTNHSRYILQLLKICKNKLEAVKILNIIDNETGKIPCNILMCGRGCKNNLDSIDAFNLLCHSYTKNYVSCIIKDIVFKYLECDDNEFRCYIPVMVYFIRFDCGNLIDYLIKRCLKSDKLVITLYLELQLYTYDDYNSDLYNTTINKLKSYLHEDPEKLNKIKNTNNCIRKINELTTFINNNKKYDELSSSVLLDNVMVSPFDTSIEIERFDLNNIKIKKSNTMPIIIPAQTKDNEIINIMHKKESMRRDQLIINIIRLMEIVLNSECIDIDIITYDVLPLNNNSSLVEIIDNCETMYHIMHKLKSTALNYILDENRNEKIGEIKTKFIKSIAAYSVITYLLGIGDRHLDNIMVKKDGRMFHIDFDYILGKDPILNDPGIRITPEMVQDIGGYGSIYYEEFENLCSVMYNTLRRKIDIFMNMLVLLPKMSNFDMSEKTIEKRIINKFIPGENEKDAKIHLVKNMQTQSKLNNIKDICHYHSKEKTVSSYMQRYCRSLSNIIFTSEQ